MKQFYLSLLKNGLKNIQVDHPRPLLVHTISRRDKIQIIRLKLNLSLDSSGLQTRGRLSPFDLLGLSMETMIPNHPLLFSSESICHQDNQSIRKKCRFSSRSLLHLKIWIQSILFFATDIWKVEVASSRSDEKCAWLYK